MPNTTSGYNGSTDFLKWYKGIYGNDYDENTGLTRKEGMSDGDWDVGTILHNYYIKNRQNEAERAENIGKINERYDQMIGTARAGYDSARKTLGENKAVAQQNASITYDKLKKYLPMKQQAQGLGGLGTQSAELDAYNRYMSQMGGIASDYQGNMRAIDDNETSHLGELERYRTDSLEENDSLYDSLARSYGEAADKDARNAWDKFETEEENRRDEAYDLIHGAVSSSKSSDVNQLLNYISAYKGKVSDAQYGALEEYVKNIAATNAKNESSELEGDRNEAYNLAQGILSSSKSSSVEDLLAYVSGFKGKVSDSQYAALEQYAKNVAATNAKNESSELEGDQSEAYNLAQGILSSSKSSSVEDLLAYVSGFKGKVSDSQYAALEQYAKNVAAINAKNESDEQTSKQESGYNSTYNMAVDVLSSSASADANELLAYVSGLQGKVSDSQYAALEQIAKNIADINAKSNNAADKDNAKEIVETVVSGMIAAGDYEGAKDYLDNNKDVLGPETTDAYNTVIESNDKVAEKTETEERQEKTKENVKIGREFVTYNGVSYKLGKELDSDNANEIWNNNSFTEQLEAAGFKDGPFDQDIPDGTTFKIKCDPLGSDKANAWDIISPFAASYLTRYVTFYDGKWYISEPQGEKKNVFQKIGDGANNFLQSYLDFVR